MSLERISELTLEELEQKMRVAEHQLELTMTVNERYLKGSQDYNMTQFLITSYQTFIASLEQAITDKQSNYVT